MTEKQEPLQQGVKTEGSSSKDGIEGNCYEQNGKFGIGGMSGGEIKDLAKVAGTINEAPSNKIEIHITNHSSHTKIDLPQPSNSDKTDRNRDCDKIDNASVTFSVVGSVEPIDAKKLKSLLLQLQKLSGDATIYIDDIELGSIRLILSGSQEGLERLEALFKSGELSEVLDIPVEDVQFIEPKISENSEDSTTSERKRLAFTIAGNIDKADLAKLKAAVVANKYKIYTENALPIPVVINIANPADSLDALNSLFNLIQDQTQYDNYRENLNKYLSITEADLVYKYQGDIFDTEHLKDFLKITKHDLERVKRKTPQNSIFYLVYIGPASVAFLVGSMLAREEMQLFQRFQDNNSYECVMNVKDRALKEDTPKFEKFDVTDPNSTSRQPKVTVAIDTAGHKIKLNDPSITSYGDLIALQNKTGHIISYQEDWTQYCREIFKVLNEAQQHYTEIKLVYSMPVSLAIAVGMTIQQFWNIQLTNYDVKTGTYQDLIKMNEITKEEVTQVHGK